MDDDHLVKGGEEISGFPSGLNGLRLKGGHIMVGDLLRKHWLPSPARTVFKLQWSWRTKTMAYTVVS